MKKALTFFAVLMIALAIPQSVKAYDFGYTYQGQTLYYNIVDGEAQVTYQYYDSYPHYSALTGSLEIPNTVTYNGTTYSVTSIGYAAFYNCRGLTSVTIPNSVTSIGDYAFYKCRGLTSVTIPNSVTSIGSEAFRNCSGLTSIVVTSGNTYYDSRENCNAIIETSTNTLIIGCQNTVIPNSVTSIGNAAFAGCSGLTSVAIPNSVTSIGYAAFEDCSGLTSVTIPNSVISIGSSAFSSCSGLTSVTIGNSVTSIGYAAFYNCSGLTSVTIPNSVTSIGNYAFDGCSGLTSVTIGNSVTSIGDHAFYGCSGLTSVTIGNSVTSIGYQAFYNCSGLTSVTIGNSVTSIGYEAFSGCSGLMDITSLAPVAPTLGSSAFSGVTSTIPVNIPCGSQMSYYSRWSYFSNFVEATGFAFSAQSADNAMGTVTVLTTPTCQLPTAVFNAVPNNGYRFDHWSDGNTDNPRTLTLISDTAVIAYFSSNEGIDEMTVTNVKIYVQGSEIVVENAEGYTVSLYDAVGRMLATKPGDGSPVRLPVATAGAYMVKVGDLPARKVVVVR